MHVPLLKEYILQGVRRKLLELFGGNVLELVIGGASINEEVETLLQHINFHIR